MGIKRWSYFNQPAPFCNKDTDPAAIIARAKRQAAQILHDAEQKAKALSVSKQIVKKPSDQFKTPDRPTSSVVSPVSGSSSKPKQYSLVIFFWHSQAERGSQPHPCRERDQGISKSTAIKGNERFNEKERRILRIIGSTAA